MSLRERVEYFVCAQGGVGGVEYFVCMRRGWILCLRVAD